MGQSSFVNAAYRDHQVGEPKSHRKGKNRIAAIIGAAGWTIKKEYEYPLRVEGEQRNYILDIYAEKRMGETTAKLDVELDGDSHNSQRRRHKDSVRDKALQEKGIRTVRFLLEDITGRWLWRSDGSKVWYCLRNAEILKELEL